MGKWAVRREKDRRLGRGDSEGPKKHNVAFPPPFSRASHVCCSLLHTEPLCWRVLKTICLRHLGSSLLWTYLDYDL